MQYGRKLKIQNQGRNSKGRRFKAASRAIPPILLTLIVIDLMSVSGILEHKGLGGLGEPAHASVGLESPSVPNSKTLTDDPTSPEFNGSIQSKFTNENDDHGEREHKSESGVRILVSTLLVGFFLFILIVTILAGLRIPPPMELHRQAKDLARIRRERL